MGISLGAPCKICPISYCPESCLYTAPSLTSVGTLFDTSSGPAADWGFPPIQHDHSLNSFGYWLIDGRGLAPFSGSDGNFTSTGGKAFKIYSFDYRSPVFPFVQVTANVPSSGRVGIDIFNTASLTLEKSSPNYNAAFTVDGVRISDTPIALGFAVLRLELISVGSPNPKVADTYTVGRSSFEETNSSCSQTMTYTIRAYVDGISVGTATTVPLKRFGSKCIDWVGLALTNGNSTSSASMGLIT